MLYIHTLFAVKRYTIMIKMLHRFIHLQVDAIHETFLLRFLSIYLIRPILSPIQNMIQTFKGLMLVLSFFIR